MKPKELQSSFENAIFPALSFIEGILVASKSYRQDSLDIYVNRFLISCRDFALAAKRRNLLNMHVHRKLSDLLSITAVEIRRTELSFADQIISETFIKANNLTKEDHEELDKMSKKSIRSLHDLSCGIRKNYKPETAHILDEEISWCIICLKQCRTKLKSILSKDHKDATIYL